MSADDEIKRLETSEAYEIIESVFFFSNPKANMDAATRSLIFHSKQSTFPVLYKIFPDHPPATNDNFFMNALNYLVQLGNQVEILNWVPHWITAANGSATKADEAIGDLIQLCLSHFENDHGRKTVLLYANACRRVAKILLITAPAS